VRVGIACLAVVIAYLVAFDVVFEKPSPSIRLSTCPESISVQERVRWCASEMERGRERGRER